MRSAFWLRFAATITLLVIDAAASRRSTPAIALLAGLEWKRRWSVYFALSVAIALLGIYGRQQFIYFQF